MLQHILFHTEVLCASTAWLVIINNSNNTSMWVHYHDIKNTGQPVLSSVDKLGKCNIGRRCQKTWISILLLLQQWWWNHHLGQGKRSLTKHTTIDLLLPTGSGVSLLLKEKQWKTTKFVSGARFRFIQRRNNSTIFFVSLCWNKGQDTETLYWLSEVIFWDEPDHHGE